MPTWKGHSFFCQDSASGAVKPPLTFVTTCKGRLSNLQQSLPRLVAQPQSCCVVVDYSCPESCGDWVEQRFPSVDVVRVAGESSFQPSRAKNAGVKHVHTEWVCLVDADILLEPGFTDAMLSRLRPAAYFRGPERGEGKFGTMVCGTEAFRAIGGFDERFQGWGDEDADLYDALRFHGLQQEFIPGPLFQHIDHDNTERVKYYDVSCREESLNVNRIYRLAKWDLARIHEHPLTPTQCERLYRIVRKKIHRVWREGTEEIHFDTKHVELQMGPWRLERRLVYRITRS